MFYVTQNGSFWRPVLCWVGHETLTYFLIYLFTYLLNNRPIPFPGRRS